MSEQVPDNPDGLVDLFGTSINLNAGVERELAQHYPEIAIVRPVTHFYIHEAYPKEHQETVKSILRKPGFIRSLGLMDGVLEGWQQICEVGIRPRICSSPPYDSPKSIQESVDLLEEHFVPVLGYGVIDNAIFDKDKSLYDALLLLDDKPEVTGAENASWTHVVYDAPYNQPFDLASRLRPRIYGWRDSELPSLIRRLLVETNE